jgi:16S rRNA (guanine966-N2)-methyltransferase
MPQRNPHSSLPGSVRIIGGAFRGRRLPLPRDTNVRPTPDRVRETVFNWLGNDISGARCLDLFAGSGALGLEALSRGAANVVFVERDRRLVRAIRDSVNKLGTNGTVVSTSVDDFLRSHAEAAFDLVFVDPPYDLPLAPILERLEPLMSSAARVYAERPARVGLPDISWGRWIKHGRAGAIVFGLADVSVVRNDPPFARG